MATFDPNVQKTNDPSYLGYSQGTEKASLQPLATGQDISTRYVQPDYKSDHSLGRLFEGLGDVGKAGLNLTDSVIKQNIDADLNKGINKIRDSFGVAAAADQSNGLASAVGAGGAEGVSLSDGSGKQPLALSRLGNKIDGLYEAYSQGNLSNSAYYAKMEAFVRQTKAQYPGYSNEVDQMTSSKLGVNPANAVRAALLDDVAQLASKVQAQNDKWTTFERSNSGTIYSLWPNYDQLKSEGKINNSQVEAGVGQYNAKIQQMDVRMKQLALGKTNDEAFGVKVHQAATEDSVSIVNDTINRLSTSLGMNAEKMQNYLIDVQSGKRPPPTPDEKTALSANFAILEQQANAALDSYFTKKTFDFSGHETTVGALIGSPDKIAQIKSLALSRLATIKSGLFDEKSGLMVMQAQNSKAMEEAAANSVLKGFPAIAGAEQIHKRLGDSGVSWLFLNAPKFTDPILAGFQHYNLGEIASGGSSIRKITDDFRREGQNDGNLNRRVIADTLEIIQNPDKMADPTVAKAAVQHAFGPDNRTLIESVGEKNKTAFFNQMGSPGVSKSIKKMDASSRETYVSWMEDAFASVYKTEVDNVNSFVENGKKYTDFWQGQKLSVKYDPVGTKFVFEGKTTLTGINPQNGNKAIENFNSAIKTMEGVWSQMGHKDTAKELYRLLPVAGIEPGSPIYKALQEYIQSQETQ